MFLRCIWCGLLLCWPKPTPTIYGPPLSTPLSELKPWLKLQAFADLCQMWYVPSTKNQDAEASITFIPPLEVSIFTQSQTSCYSVRRRRGAFRFQHWVLFLKKIEAPVNIYQSWRLPPCDECIVFFGGGLRFFKAGALPWGTHPRQGKVSHSDSFWRTTSEFAASICSSGIRAWWGLLWKCIEKTRMPK